MRSSEAYRVALHEAAHAVTAAAASLCLCYVTVKPSQGLRRVPCVGAAGFEALGSLGHAWVASSGPNVDPEPYLLMLLAGAAAERHAFGVASLDSSRDFDEAREIVWCCDDHRLGHRDEDTEAAMPRWHRKADALVAAHWPWIERVADELLRKTGLMADEVVALR